MENHLTGKLFIPILLISFLGFGMSFFPLALDGGIGPNAYLLLIIGFLITILGLIGLHRSAFKYPGQSLVHEAGKLLGPIGKVGNIIFLSIVFLFIAILVGRITDIISAMVLFRTPDWIVDITYLLVILYIAVKGTETVGRLSSLLMALVPLLAVLLGMGLKNVNYLNIHPVYIIRDIDAFEKWPLGLVAFAPVWIIAFLNGKDNLRSGLKPILGTVTLGTFILCSITLLVTGVFGPNGVKRYEWPLLDLMSTTGFASNYFFQNIVNSIYIFIDLLFTLITAAVFLALLSSNLMALFSLKPKRSRLVLLIITSAIFGVMTISSVITFKTGANLLLEAGSIYILLYVMIIWSVSLFRKQA